ncbi:MAG: NAD(P)/FAD-dependent oxidoreductase [Rubrobacter sp.]
MAYSGFASGDTASSKAKHYRLIVVGAGFAGSSLLKSLPRSLGRPGQTLLISRSAEYTYLPLIHEVAVGRLGPKTVSSPIHPIYNGRADFLKADVTGISLEDRTVHTSEGAVSYEYLVVATGAQAALPPKTLAPHFRLFWSLEDALGLRSDLAALWDTTTGSRGLRNDSESSTLAIVGGGATGVELAGEIATLFQYLEGRAGFATRPYEKPRVVLLEATDRLMGWLDPYFHETALKGLTALGVEVRLGSRVEEADERGLSTKEGYLPAAVRLWTAGLEVGGLAATLPGERDPSGRLLSSPHLTLPGHPEVYVLGDVGVHRDRHHGPLPPTASVAVQQGPFAARDLGRRTGDYGTEIRRRPEFEYFDRGYIVSLGPEDAAADAFGRKFSGPAAQALYRSVLLFYLGSRARRTLATSEWAIERLGRLGF